MKKIKQIKALTLIEILIAVVCFALVSAAMYSTLSAGKRSSLSGIMRIEATLEATKILKQIRSDLNASCFQPPINAMYDIDHLFKETGIAPNIVYSFFSFPIRGDISDWFTSPSSGENPRRVAKITYKTESSPNPDTNSLRLIREELYQGQTIERVLSDKVNYFEIKPLLMQVDNKNQFYFLITLQLVDSVDPSKLAQQQQQRIDALQQHIILADFYDVVYSEFFNAAWNNALYVPNWHTIKLDTP